MMQVVVQRGVPSEATCSAGWWLMLWEKNSSPILSVTGIAATDVTML
jgi:hypothetical protein